jgi:hypothetical protein
MRRVAFRDLKDCETTDSGTSWQGKVGETLETQRPLSVGIYNVLRPGLIRVLEP